MEQSASRFIKVKRQGFFGGDPFKLLGLMIKPGVEWGAGAARVIEENKMLSTKEFGRKDGVLNHDEFNVVDLKMSLLENLASQGAKRAFPPLDFSTRNSPFVRPFMGLNHEHPVL